MDKATPNPPATRPRFAKSAELLNQDVEILFVDEVDSDYGPEYLFDLRVSGGEVVSYSRHRDDWRRPGVEAMRALLDAGEPVRARLIQPGRALLWSPFDQRGSRMSDARATKLRQLGFDLDVDDATPF